MEVKTDSRDAVVRGELQGGVPGREVHKPSSAKTLLTEPGSHV